MIFFAAAFARRHAADYDFHADYAAACLIISVLDIISPPFRRHIDYADTLR